MREKAGFGKWTHEDVEQRVRRTIPGAFFVVIHRATNTIVATGTALHSPKPDIPYGGELGWIAADPVHSGKGLGFAVSAAPLRRMIQAGAIYRHILAEKDNGGFVVEVSVDETDSPQTPDELFLILAMLAMEGVPVQTIAPKFTGRFKGVDCVGDHTQFVKEFDEDIAVLAFAVREFGLPSSLKLSVHSGSDKFSIYPLISKLIKKHGCGLHVKTAGTTWLEEVIGLAEAGGDGLAIAIDDGLCTWEPLPQRMEKHDAIFREMKMALGIRSIDWIIPTHYHGDHTEFIPHLAEMEGARVIALDSICGPMEFPERYNMACPLPWYGAVSERLTIHEKVPEGHLLRWGGYELTFFHLGGQTKHHLGVEAVIDGLKVLFVGDAWWGTATAPSPVLCWNEADPLDGGWPYAYDRMIG